MRISSDLLGVDWQATGILLLLLTRLGPICRLLADRLGDRAVEQSHPPGHTSETEMWRRVEQREHIEALADQAKQRVIDAAVRFGQS